MTTPPTPPRWADEAAPGWLPARITPYGPGYSRDVPGKGVLQVGYENRQYRWWLQIGPAKAMPGRGGFARGREAMRDADRLAGMPAPGMAAAVTAGELREVPATDQAIRAGATGRAGT